MASRYSSRSFIFNDNEEYKKAFFNDRGVGEIVQYDTANFSYPTVEEMNTLSTLSYIICHQSTMVLQLIGGL